MMPQRALGYDRANTQVFAPTGPRCDPIMMQRETLQGDATTMIQRRAETPPMTMMKYEAIEPRTGEELAHQMLEALGRLEDAAPDTLPSDAVGVPPIKMGCSLAWLVSYAMLIGIMIVDIMAWLWSAWDVVATLLDRPLPRCTKKCRATMNEATR